MSKHFSRILKAQPTPELADALNRVPFRLPGENHSHWKCRAKWLKRTFGKECVAAATCLLPVLSPLT